MHSVEQTLNLAVQYHQGGNFQQAELLYRQILQVDSQHVDTLHMFGLLFHHVGRNDLAVDYIQQALRLRSNFPSAYNNLAIALKDQGRLAEAISSYQQALLLKPDYAEAHNNLGNALKDQGRLVEAIASYQQALRLKPGYADAHYNLGSAFTELGRFTEAIASLRESLRLRPKHAEALGQLASLLRDKLPQADRVFLEHRLAESGLNDSERVKLLFGLAEVCDAKGEYGHAAALLGQANTLNMSVCRRKKEAYRLDEGTSLVDNVIRTFTQAFFERVRGFGLETDRPVFIVGLPRSGTTLTEQILAAHSQVYGAGELKLARMNFLALGTQRTNESVFATLPGLPGEAFHRQAQLHLDQLKTVNATAARVVDKMPSNCFYLGLLAAMFPRAKFIHCRRDLRDVAVSWWMTPVIEWAENPEHIVARFRNYQRVMEHWRMVLPVPIVEVHYEEMVADLPVVARRLVEWCGLDWEPACLRFNEGSRPVQTASKIQVREPIFTRSVGRWRNYEKELNDLFAALQSL